MGDRSGTGIWRVLPSGAAALNRRLQSHQAARRALTQTLIGGISIQVTLIATGVMLARALGPEDRGYLAMLILIGVLAVQITPMGLPYALTYAIARVPGRAIDVVRELKRAIWIRLLAGPLFTALLLGGLTIGKPTYVRIGAVAVVAVMAFAFVQRCGLAMLQGFQEFTSFNVLRVAPNAAFALGVGALLLVGKDEFIAMAFAWAVSRGMFAPVTIRRARKEAERHQDPGAPDPPETSWILRFGRRSMIGAAPPVEAYRIDQSVVALFLAPTSLGLYVVALAFVNLPRFIAQAVGMVASPLTSASESQAGAKRRMWQFFWGAIPLYLPIIIALWIAAPQLTEFFFGTEFADAAPLSRLLLIATVPYCARRVLTDAARGAGYSGAGSVAELAAFLGVIPMFAVLVPMSGVLGVGYALIASSALAFAVLVGMLLHSRARHSTPSGWFDALAPARPDTSETA